jgi:hypothetical protein
MAMQDQISIIYSLARSGGTIISKCVGSIPGNVLLSEVHPRWAFFDPMDQACDWFGLVSDAERHEFRVRTDIDYLQRIQLIHSRCAARGLHLIIRDWTHVDFFHGPYAVQPACRLSQYDCLKEHFHVNHVAIIRHPLDAYLSLRQVPPYRPMGFDYYLPRFRLFADRAGDVGLVRYEDFCDDPQTVVRKICEKLAVNYTDEFMSNYANYTTITGDVSDGDQKSTQTGEPVGTRVSSEIRRPPRRTTHGLPDSELRDDALYRNTLKNLGYDP